MKPSVHLAETLAEEAHKEQTYGGESYFKKHITGVAVSIAAHGLPEEYVIVANLHDIVEDTTVSLETIYNLFGKVVGEAVDAITKRDGEDRHTYLARCASNKIARVVKLHDAMFNATSCHKNKNKTKFNYYLQTIAALEQK